MLICWSQERGTGDIKILKHSEAHTCRYQSLLVISAEDPDPETVCFVFYGLSGSVYSTGIRIRTCHKKTCIRIRTWFDPYIIGSP